MFTAEIDLLHYNRRQDYEYPVPYAATGTVEEREGQEPLIRIVALTCLEGDSQYVPSDLNESQRTHVEEGLWEAFLSAQAKAHKAQRQAAQEAAFSNGYASALAKEVVCKATKMGVPRRVVLGALVQAIREEEAAHE